MALSVKAVLRKALELCGPTVLVALVVWMLHVSLFSGGELVPAHAGTDLHLEFLGWRHFGFTSWLTGHFPFWNPHVFCGIPFFAQIQSCMLYPIAWVNLLCTTATATTIEIAANLCSAAICMYAWARQRGTSRCGATLAGAAFTFSGLVYLRVMAGHLTPLATLAWIPLVFLALDRLLSDRLLSGMLIGVIAVCLQWLGGHPQLVYYTMLIGGLYVLLLSIGRPRMIRILAACLGMFILGSLLAAMQVIPAILASKLTLRSGPMSYEFASLFSFPPENLLTLFVPYPLGDALHTPYVGRWYIWETSVYIGIINLALAGIALANMGSKRWRILALLGATMILMLGTYTPAYCYLYEYLPGFAMFRDTGKFGMFWVLLLAVLAGEGFDLLRQRQTSRQAMAILGVAMICFVVGGIFLLFNSTGGTAATLFALIIRSASSYSQHLLVQPHLGQMMAPWIACQWFIAGGLMLAAGALLLARRWVRIAPYVLLALAIADVYLAAWDSSVVSRVQLPSLSQWMPAIDKAAAANQRVLFPDSDNYGNSGNLLDFDSLWGYDPGQPRLYSQLIAAAEHQYLPEADQYTPHFSNASRIFQLLRCRYVLQSRKSNPVVDVPAPMPQLLLVGSYYLLADPQVTADLLASSFQFRQTVILDRVPVPLPTDAGANGNVRLVRQSINDMEIVADLPAPAMLLITDAYAPGWNVRALEPNANQGSYDVMRADDVLRAVPLAAGHHHFDVYYVPPGLRAGECLSGAGLILLAAGIARLLRQRKTPVA